MEVVISNFEDLHEKCANGFPLVSIGKIIEHIVENNHIDRDGLESEFKNSLSDLSPSLDMNSLITVELSKIICSSMIQRFKGASNNVIDIDRPDSGIGFNNNDLEIEKMNAQEHMEKSKDYKLKINHLESIISGLKEEINTAYVLNSELTEKNSQTLKECAEIKITVENLKDSKNGLSKTNEDLIKEVEDLQTKIASIKKLSAKEKLEFENMKLMFIENENYNSTCLQNQIEKNIELDNTISEHIQKFEELSSITNSPHPLEPHHLNRHQLYTYI